MPPMTGFFRPKAPRSGVMVVLGAAAIGTGGYPLTATATVSVQIPVPRRKCKLVSLNLNATLAAAGGSTITARVYKRNNVPASPADVALSAAKDITATVITVADKAYDIAITGTDAQCIFQVGDTCRVDLAAATTVTTAPQMVLSAEFLLLE